MYICTYVQIVMLFTVYSNNSTVEKIIMYNHIHISDCTVYSNNSTVERIIVYKHTCTYV